MDEYQPLRPPRSDTLELRGLRTHITRWGPEPSAQVPPVVLLHGFADTAATFQLLVDCFTVERPLIALDWRGFGHSAWAQDGYWFPDYLADLDAFIDVIAPASPVGIIGHSMGGNVASQYAGVRPARVRWLINLEGFGLPRVASETAPQHIRRWLDEQKTVPKFRSYESFSQLADVIALRYPRIPRERALFIARAWARCGSDGKIRLLGDPKHRRSNPVLYRREESDSCWRNIVAPVLMLFGEHSEFADRLGADGTEQAFHELLPGIKTDTIAAAGHMLHIERPEVVAVHIEKFLQTLAVV